MGVISSMFVIPNILFFFFETTYGIDSITSTQFLADGKTLVSKDGNFELGFFNPGSSKNRYLGIWYNIQDKTVVWVANRDSPINDSSGILMINSTGSLVLLSQNKSVVWSTSSLKQAQTPLLQLLDTGNLVLTDEKNGNLEDYLWQSFDYPTDTFLPGMKLGWDLKRGLNRRLIGWKNWDDPSSGDLIHEMTLHNYPEAYLFKGTVKYYRTGPWNGIGYSGTPEIKPNPVYAFTFVYNQDEVYFMFTRKDKSLFTRTGPNQTTSLFQSFIRKETAQSWKLYTAQPADRCDSYGVCGAYGICIVTELPVCQCLKGFNPKSQQKWDSMDGSQGCVRNKPLNCQEIITHGFVKFPNLKVPDTTYTWVNTSMNLKECREKCLSNCSCTAYTNSDIKKGIGCAIWFGDLLDIKQFPDGGQDLYIRMHPLELGMENGHKKNIAVIVACSIVVVFGMLLGSYYVCSKENLRGIMERMRIIVHTSNSKGPEEDMEIPLLDMELPLFDLSTIARATDDFSLNNKLGEGGFGSVYKGTLLQGKNIAVKRLSKTSGQGLNEFKNEVNLIAKLQHRNLVKLFGSCIQENEKMLIYEYMPNKSLDSFIFDQTKSNFLDWRKRINIIGGIARGLLYLHQDSRLRIIHRDLKASNILLDNNMNPKISDFGIAKSFGGDQCDANTNRIVVTFLSGYMSPEYAVHGQYSIKSDVFSFGVLILEIISGKKNRGFHHPEHHLNLLGHAWRLWIEDRPIELIDDSVGEFTISEVLRCIHVGLLCVQQRQEDRPNMLSVVLMLSSESLLPKPKQPGFYIDSPPETDSSLSTPCSENKITFTLFEAR